MPDVKQEVIKVIDDMIVHQAFREREALAERLPDFQEACYASEVIVALEVLRKKVVSLAS